MPIEENSLSLSAKKHHPLQIANNPTHKVTITIFSCQRQDDCFSFAGISRQMKNNKYLCDLRVSSEAGGEYIKGRTSYNLLCLDFQLINYKETILVPSRSAINHCSFFIPCIDELHLRMPSISSRSSLLFGPSICIQTSLRDMIRVGKISPVNP
jgi:hypothetical protein